MTNWGIVGHEWAVALLRRALSEGRLGHAYLLTGPPRVGKRTLALALAKALLCSSGSPPCGECRTCMLVDRGRHPDLRIVERPPDRKHLSIDEVRDLQHWAGLRPVEGAYHVGVVLHAEDLSQEAANALLKTLEEPPPSLVLVLTAADAGLLLPTVVSRCQHLLLRRVPTAAIAGHLVRELGKGEEEARLLASLANGRPGWAVEAARDEALLAARLRALDDLEMLLNASRIDRLQYARGLAQLWGSERGEEVRDALLHWLGWWRDALLVALGQPALVWNHDRLDTLVRAADRLALEDVRGAGEAVQRALTHLQQNVNPRLALDVLLLALPRLGDRSSARVSPSRR